MRRAALVAVALFLAASALPHVRFFQQRHESLGDVLLYQVRANEMLDGQIPYHDFFMEYPPGALPVFVLPAIRGKSEARYALYFKLLLTGLGVVALTAAALILTELGANRRRLYGGLALVAVSPALLGPVFYLRYDLWPAALTIVALAALVSGRDRLGLAVLAVAAAAKVYPAVLLPLAFAFVWKRRGRRAALQGLGLFVGVVAAIMLPFAVVGFGGLGYSFYVQTTRSLEIESLAASFLLGAHQLGIYTANVVPGLSFNLSGSLPTALGLLQTAIQVAVVVAVWIWFAQGRGGREELLTASAAAVAAFVAFGKVLSPQFLVWLVPLVPLVAGRAGLAASGLLAAALLLTQAWFPARFKAVRDLGWPDWLVLPRNLVLVALTAVLVLAVRSGRVRSS